MTTYTVSQIARRTGVTVRALHHYQAMGLLMPSARSASGYRLYGERELRRLQHIASLKALGFSLAQIRVGLDADAPSLGESLLRQAARLRASVARQVDALERLEQVARRIADGDAVDTETLLNSIEATTIMEKYFSQDQLQAIGERADLLGAERIRKVELAWPDVIAGMKAALALGKDPACREVQALARRWRSLVSEFTGGDAGIAHSVGEMFREQPDAMRTRVGIDPALMTYASRAIARLGD